MRFCALDDAGHVFRRFLRLYKRYAKRHFSLQMAPFDVSGFGCIDRVHICNGQFQIAGSSNANQVQLTNEISHRATQTDADGKFELQIPYSVNPPLISNQDGGETWEIRIPSSLLLWRHLVLMPEFIGRFAKAVPAAMQWFRTHDIASRIAVRNHLGLEPLSDNIKLDHTALATKECWRVNEKSIDPAIIVVPVYDALGILRSALTRLLDHTNVPWALVLIEDKSTDPRVRPFLQDWCKKARHRNPHLLWVKQINNPENKGFVGSVNAGFQYVLNKSGPLAGVVLLNSDAMVPDGWLKRLMAPIKSDPSIASVTPMSNDAELQTIPQISTPVNLRHGAVDLIDQKASELFGATCPTIPTGVGFCIAISVPYLRQLPQFDPVFGAGYGEEVDWCEKAKSLGGRHVVQPALFVEHGGAASFGTERKQNLLVKNSQILSSRYPQFDQTVADFVDGDPLRTQRLFLSFAWASANAGAKPIRVYLGHTLGGGAEINLIHRIQTDIQQTGAAVVIRVGGPSTYAIELHFDGGIIAGETNETGLVQKLINVLDQNKLVYSCGVGAKDPSRLPDLILSLKSEKTRGIEVLFHDYLPLHPHYTLLDRNGTFKGVDFDVDPAISKQSLIEWRNSWTKLIQAANRIEVFSQSSAQLVLSTYPQAKKALVVKPHALSTQIKKVMHEPQLFKDPVIGVLGNIGFQKGAKILSKLSRHWDKTGAAKMVLIGDLDPSYTLGKSAKIHGKYDVEDLEQLIETYGIDRWLIPSIWPETFSFTTHEALATGLPVFVFDLGAQAEAANAAENGVVMQLDNDIASLSTHLTNLQKGTSTNVDTAGFAA